MNESIFLWVLTLLPVADLDAVVRLCDCAVVRLLCNEEEANAHLLFIINR